MCDAKTLTTMIAIFPPTSPTTLIGGLALGRNPEKRREINRIIIIIYYCSVIQIQQYLSNTNPKTAETRLEALIKMATICI